MMYLATFHTHYGAMRFHRHCQNVGVASKMAPVPRELSASCGVCVRFDADSAPVVAAHEDMERCYLVSQEGRYMPLAEP